MKVYASEISVEGFEDSSITSGLATTLEDWTWVLISAKDGSSSGSKNKIDALISKNRRRPGKVALLFPWSSLNLDGCWKVPHTVEEGLLSSGNNPIDQPTRKSFR